MLVAVVFMLLFGAVILAFFSGVSVPLVTEGQTGVLSFWDNLMTAIGC